MLIYLFQQKSFLVGLFSEVVDFLLRKNRLDKNSLIILPCSLHDLALDEKLLYKNVDFYTNDSMFITYYFCLKFKQKIDRIYGPNLMLKILEKEQTNLSKKKHYFLAPSKKTFLALKALLKKNYKELDLSLEFLTEDSNSKVEVNVLQKIIKAKPDFIWLGIGSPKQVELANYLKIHSAGAKIFCVGAAFEFLTKQKKQAPLFLQNFGLEWLFRLSTEPKRLWRRYLIVIPKFLFLILWRKIFPHNRTRKLK